MRHLVTGSLLAAAFGVALAVTSAAPASAQLARPQTTMQLGASNDLVTEVQWRGRRGGRHHHHRHGGGAGIGLGLAAGALIGAGIAAQSAPYYYGQPAAVYEAPDDEVGYCMQRFKSYDPRSGTYLGYDGLRHPCP